MLLQGETRRKNGGKKISTPSSRCDVDMCRTGFHKKVIVWLNCAQWIVTVVGSEVRVLAGWAEPCPHVAMVPQLSSPYCPTNYP